MAEGILKKIIEEQGAQLVTVKSAGIAAIEGMPASFIGISVARAHGINIMHHRSQPVTKKLLEKSDLALVMGEDHLKYINEKYPQFSEKVHLLRNYGRSEPAEEQNVFDPIGSEGEVYEEVFQLLETEMNRVAPFIVNKSMEKMG